MDRRMDEKSRWIERKKDMEKGNTSEARIGWKSFAFKNMLTMIVQK